MTAPLALRPRYLLGAILYASCHPDEGFGGVRGVAFRLGLTRGGLYDIILGRAEPEPSVLRGIASLLGVSEAEAAEWQRTFNTSGPAA